MGNHFARESQWRTRPSTEEVRAYAEAIAIDFQEAAIFRRMMRDDAARKDLERAGFGGLK